jgi:hypothetical protein
MEEPTHQQQDRQTDSSSQHGQQTMRLQVPDEAACELGETVVGSGFDVTQCALLHLLQSLIPLTDENLDQWTWEECRDYLHWCLDEGVLTIQNGRLVPVEELIPTAPLTHDTDGETPKSAEDAGLNSVVYASTPNMPIHAYESAQEGVDECSHVFQQDGGGTIG